MKLFIDDERFPPKDVGWTIVRSSDEAISFVKNNGIPSFISFDHDLGGDDTSMVFLRWLIEYCLDHENYKFEFDYAIHSQNPVGRENIKSLIESFRRSRG